VYRKLLKIKNKKNLVTWNLPFNGVCLDPKPPRTGSLVVSYKYFQLRLSLLLLCSSIPLLLLNQWAMKICNPNENEEKSNTNRIKDPDNSRNLEWHPNLPNIN